VASEKGGAADAGGAGNAGRAGAAGDTAGAGHAAAAGEKGGAGAAADAGGAGDVAGAADAGRAGAAGDAAGAGDAAAPGEKGGAGGAGHTGEWLELAAEAEPEAVEALSAAFAEWGQGVAIEQVVHSSRDGDELVYPPDAPLLVKTYLPLHDPTSPERRREIEKAVWALGLLRHVGPLEARSLREADWADAWKRYFFVQRVGRRTVVVPSWRQAEYAPQPDDIPLLLDPGMAFGTGLHPTTQLCLRAVEERVQPGQRVLDLGAGSGILAIAASKLGAEYVEAVEIDPVAARVCRENAELNGVSGRTTVIEGALEAEGERFDLALANITIRVLLEVHPILARRLRPGGTAVMSGVLVERADELVDVLSGAGWRHVRTDQEQDWVALIVEAPG
jgi:ribosomal protein L11 methyltransferase